MFITPSIIILSDESLRVPTSLTMRSRLAVNNLPGYA